MKAFLQLDCKKAFNNQTDVSRIVRAFQAIADGHKPLKLVLAGTPAWEDMTSFFE